MKKELHLLGDDGKENYLNIGSVVVLIVAKLCILLTIKSFIKRLRGNDRKTINLTSRLFLRLPLPLLFYSSIGKCFIWIGLSTGQPFSNNLIGGFYFLLFPLLCFCCLTQLLCSGWFLLTKYFESLLSRIDC